jgi:hypothetical protein
MGKAIVTVAALGLMWLGYISWPLYDLYALVNAFEKRDVQTVVRHVYFDSVRRSLADQILAAYVQRAYSNAKRPLIPTDGGQDSN